jgi:Do/DeqQ family serine protease
LQQRCSGTNEEAAMSIPSLIAAQGLVLALVASFAPGCHGGNALEDLEYRVDERPIDRGERGYVSSYAPILQDVRPAVVSVFSRRVVEAREMWDHPLSEQVFRDQPPSDHLQEGIGSGIVISPRGYVLTNNHVLADADTIAVLLADGREFDAEVVGRDPQTDIALLRIPADRLESATLTDSDQVEVGDIVFALGNTLGLGHAVTTGIISARGLTDVGILSLENFLQTDASMNLGNSGGPLVDAWGRVIGINTAIASPGMGNVGVGFAIPINMARVIMSDLIEHGEVRRGFLGIQMRPISGETLEQFGIRDLRGALVVQVVPGSPAANAGVRSGDIIVAIDQDAVEAPGDLRNRVAMMSPGDRVELRLIRNGERAMVAAVLGRQP